MSDISIILVSPQLGENIGAAARIMANFGFSDFRIVNPRDGWPNKKAEIMSACGIEVLQNAKIYENLHDAVGDLEEIYACTARDRKMYKSHVSLKDHIEEITLCDLDTKKIGIMFGSERCGLLNEEIIYAKKIINIRTNNKSPVLNLAQAVAIICYEHYNLLQESMKKSSKYKKRNAKMSEMIFFLEELKNNLDKTGFFKDEDRKIKMYQNISNIFIRNNLSGQEIKTLVGAFKALYNFTEDDKNKIMERK